MIRAGHDLAEEASKLAQLAHGASVFTLKDRSKDAAYQALFSSMDPERSVGMFRQQMDARVWMHLVSLTGMSNLMDRTAKEQLNQDLCTVVPEVSEDTARLIFEAFLGDAQLIFQRGLARAFSDLDRRFKSHDAFKLGSRVVLTRVFNEYGSWNYNSGMRDTLADIERVFAVLDGKTPDCGALARAIEEDRKGWNPRQSLTTTPYFKVRGYKNGNAHLWFMRDDLVTKANQVLADYYGEVLPDAAVHEDTPDDLRSKSGLPSKKLSYYPTPDKVTQKILRDVYLNEDSRVLEPSAGTGDMVAQILETGAHVHAIEIHGGRAASIPSHPNLTVQVGNFLQTPATPVYTHVLMNPPFYGTHWMQHVLHAFDFLAPGGVLVAILPVSADLSQSNKHTVFKKWAKQRSRGCGRLFYDLPAESFAESGTRVNTVTLTLFKPRER